MPFKTPLAEAVAEVDFVPPALLEFRAATLYNVLRDRFPNYIRFPIILMPSEATGGVAAAPYAPAYRFSSQDGKKMLQYGPRMLTYNTLSYEGWGVFSEDFRHVFRSAADLDFGLVMERLALTYVNRMPVGTPQALQELLSVDLGINDNTAPVDFIIRKVDAHDGGLSVTLIQPLSPDDIFNMPAIGITCAEIGFVQGEFNYTNIERLSGWFDDAHSRTKERFWTMLKPEVQEDWKETYAARTA